MTVERLEAYRSMKGEIREWKQKLEHLGEDDSLVGSSTVFDYRSGYPVPQSVVGVDWGEYDRLKRRYLGKIGELEKECAAIEDYIDGIGDSLTRRIFRMYFLEGKTQKEIGKAVSLDRSRVSRKINSYFC